MYSNRLLPEPRNDELIVPQAESQPVAYRPAYFESSGYQETEEGDIGQILEYARVLSERKWFILSAGVSCFFLAGRVALLITLITVFEFPVTLAQELANQPPAKQEPAITNSGLRTSYTLGPEDQISITVLDMEEISRGGYRIDGKGYISVPLLGRVKAGGLTIKQFEAGLIDQLKTYVHDPQITVAVTEFRSQTVSVLGAVNNPGVQVLQGRKTLVEILSMAGGTKPDAGYSLMIIRKVRQGELPLPQAALDPTGKFYIAEVNLNDILIATKPELNIQVQPDDIISVPRGELVYVIGEVKKAGGFVLNEKLTVSVLKALALAEGMTPEAAPKAAAILRDVQGASRQEIPVNLKDIMSGKSKDIAMMSNDILFVPKNVVKGAIGKIGQNAIYAGMRMAIYRVP